jgi:hypothetical protein
MTWPSCSQNSVLDGDNPPQACVQLEIIGYQSRSADGVARWTSAGVPYRDEAPFSLWLPLVPETDPLF